MLLKNYLKNFFLILFFLFLFNQNSFSLEPNKFIQKIVNEASKALINNVSKEDKMNKLKAIAIKSVDIRGIGMYTLGSHRKNLSEKQTKDYHNLFKEYFLKSFSSRLSEYTDPKINVISQEKINEKYTIVSSILLATDKTPQIRIDWRVYTKNKNEPLIRDLIIEGLSLAKTQKEEFNSIILNNEGDINVLLFNLKEFIEN